MLSALLVDDLASYRKLVRFVLEDTGQFTVAGEASDGVEAIDLAARLLPDLVLLDLSMPRMDGLQALPLIKDASPDSKVVVLTALDLHRVSPIATQRGALACLEKGIRPNELVRALLKLLNGHGPPA
jgi:DNA-binding NarL/FixJ family response regulator